MVSTSLIRKDIKNLFRDPLMVVILIIPLIMASLVKVYHHFDPLSFLPFEVDGELIGLMLRQITPLFGGIMSGWISGFLILEEKENGLIPQLLVTPLGSKDLIDNRIFLTLTTGLILESLLCLADSLLYESSWGSPFSFLLCALTGPFVMTVMARWGRNRVQGLTLAKLTSLLIVPPILSFILPAVRPVLWIIISPATAFLHNSPGEMTAGGVLLIIYTVAIRRKA